MMKTVTLRAMLASLMVGIAAWAAEGAEAAQTAAANAAAGTEAAQTAAAGTGAAAGAAASAAEANAITLLSIMENGGGLMYVIAALSLVAITLMIFYVLTLRESVLCPRQFLLEAEDAADMGDISALKEVCNENDCVVARILRAALSQCDENKGIDYEFLRDGIEAEGSRHAGLLTSRLQYLMDIAVIAPMVGLLGTIWGMMLSFQNFKNSDISTKAQQLTDGVSTAMYTTFGGLIVGIFAMGAYDILRGHLNKLIGTMECSCGSVLRRLAPRLRR